MAPIEDGIDLAFNKIQFFNSRNVRGETNNGLPSQTNQ